MMEKFMLIQFRQTLLVATLERYEIKCRFSGTPFPNWEILPKQLSIDEFFKKTCKLANVDREVMEFFADFSSSNHSIIKITDTGVCTSLNDNCFIQYHTFKKSFSVGTSNTNIILSLTNYRQQKSDLSVITLFENVPLDILKMIFAKKE